MRPIEKSVLTILALLLTAALIGRLYTRGGPYFERPETIVDHVGRGRHATRDALVLLPKVRPLLPRGAQVTCFRPVDGGRPREDSDNFLAAVGQLPEQSVLPPFARAEYVVAVREPFVESGYTQIAEFPEGRLYRR